MSFKIQVSIHTFSAAIMLLFSAGCSCGNSSCEGTTQSDTTHSSFAFDEFGRIRSSCIIHSKKYVAIFDTGASGLILDSLQFKNFVYNDSLKTSIMHYASQNISKTVLSVSQGIDVTFCGRNLHFKEFFLADVKERFNADVIFSLPKANEYVMHIDYQKHEMSLFDSIPGQIASTHPVQSTIDIDEGDIVVSLPFSLINCSGEILRFNINGAIDTGSGGYLISYGGLYTLGDKHIVSFINHEQKYHCQTGDGLYIIPQVSPYKDMFIIKVKNDSDISTLVFGNALLAHYDLWLDFKKLRMYARVQDYYVHPYNDFLEAEGKNLYVNKVQEGVYVECCRKSSLLWSAGLRHGDLIIGMDGHFSSNITKTDVTDFFRGEGKHEFYIYRNKDTLTISSKSLM